MNREPQFTTYDYMSFLFGMYEYHPVSEATGRAGGKSFSVELFEIQETEHSRMKWAVIESVPGSKTAHKVYLLDDPRNVVSFYDTRRRYMNVLVQRALEDSMKPQLEMLLATA